ncbi:hypothetical protein V6N13_117055 [Hibiscus sabdariffa]
MPTVAPSHSMHVVVSSPSMAIAEPDHFAKVISTSVYLRLNNPIRHRLYRAQPKFPHHRPIHMNLGRTPSETEVVGPILFQWKKYYKDDYCLDSMRLLADTPTSFHFVPPYHRTDRKDRVFQKRNIHPPTTEERQLDLHVPP